MTAVDLTILYEDNHLLGLSKPGGVLLQGDRSGDVTLLSLAKTYIKRKYSKPGNVFLGLVHRLDRPVSGVVLLARTSKAASRLSRQFREGMVAKIYLAVVTGQPPALKGELVAHLAGRADRRGRTLAGWEPFPGSRPARLRYLLRERSAETALLEIQLQTGRRHQIRTQLALLGCPVLGDLKYGAAAPLPDRCIALHAWKLVVKHPISGEIVQLQAPLPPAWPWAPAHKGPGRGRSG
jgi:23S rRNA pseudouridine1911/1915/1917 synthase